MLIAIIGESCTGKSTLANKLKTYFSATVYTGKDYLRLAKSEAEAVKVFKNLLMSATTGENIIYVISEKAHLNLLPENCFKILATAELQTIKQRFAARLGGKLPPPVESMLEKNYGKFNDTPNKFHYSENSTYEDLLSEIKKFGA